MDKIILYAGNIYKYQNGLVVNLCVYLFNSDAKQKIYIIPLSEISSSETTLKLNNIEKEIDTSLMYEIDRYQIIDVLRIKGRYAQLTHGEMQTITKSIISNLSADILDDMTNNFEKHLLYEEIVKFLFWKKRKHAINYLDQNYKAIEIYSNCIYWAELGYNIGSELRKRRPVIIWKKLLNNNNVADSSCIVIPLTSKGNDKYYFHVPIVTNNITGFALINDIKRISTKRIKKPYMSGDEMSFISNNERNAVKNALMKYFVFDNKFQ